MKTLKANEIFSLNELSVTYFLKVTWVGSLAVRRFKITEILSKVQ